MIEPILFATIVYWLAGLRDNAETFGLTLLVLLLTINVSTACGKTVCLHYINKANLIEKRIKRGDLRAAVTEMHTHISGCFFSTAFESVPLAMAYLIPFDYILMITMGPFLKLGFVVFQIIFYILDSSDNFIFKYYERRKRRRKRLLRKLCLWVRACVRACVRIQSMTNEMN